MGKVRTVAAEFETATRIVKNGNAFSYAESGGFVLWPMNPDMWYFEIAVGGSKVHVGYNGKLVWRHAPWGSAHTAKGLARPLRHALQVKFWFDPRTTASIFVNGRCTREKKVNGEDCFILKLSIDPQTLRAKE
ncbi:Glutamyl-tRNA (Gln) amidotransferase subunit A (DUF620) [Melia azedarach]|uniref:Glutamyl-tRNA (Gln) amidotransferase subunit A (DUF620) n=1 Tax=Melia azedarach TaxID=155640 RepID=A0ACC1WPW9_MELAZ|nr:Glutamyl-tRNA (Gln) amidotransferase subunit A (DUF620) [Melia azedarach]